MKRKSTDNAELRQEYVSSARRVVVKLGTNILTGADRCLDTGRIGSLTEQIARLCEDGREVAVVSSGAIGAGRADLAMKRRPRTLPYLQAAASVGQGRLMAEYDAHFQKHGLHAAQILLTREDFESRQRYLNASNTIHALFSLSCVPVINENDTISTDEIRFGDNDYLAAFVTHLIRAELLVLLTSVPGLYGRKPADGGRPAVLSVVEEVSDEIKELAYAEQAPGGMGGMRSKLDAAAIATEAGEAAVIADGRREGVIQSIMAGEDVGTLFLPTSRRLSSYKRWIRFTSRPRGSITVDRGARDAVRNRGKSLLPSGITAVEGDFGPGDVVRLKGPDGGEFARGLSNYASDEIHKIRGLHSAEIEKVLGYKYYDEVVHRDNLALSD